MLRAGECWQQPRDHSALLAVLVLQQAFDLSIEDAAIVIHHRHNVPQLPINALETKGKYMNLYYRLFSTFSKGI